MDRQGLEWTAGLVPRKMNGVGELHHVRAPIHFVDHLRKVDRTIGTMHINGPPKQCQRLEWTAQTVPRT